MADLELKAVLGAYGQTAPLKDGTVVPRTFRLRFEEVPTIIQAFRRMVRGLEFDISEMAITTYLCARAHGKSFTAIPVFPMRAFHHGAILYNTRSGIGSPKDLEGKKVGVNRGYTVTTGLWARSILQHEYGVDLSKVTWVLSGDEHVAEYRPPANVIAAEAGRTLEDLLVAGEIAAAIGAPIEAPDVRPLIPDAAEAGFRALRDRGLYPINHTVVVRNDVLSAHPDLAADFFDACVQAKHLYIARLEAGTLEAPSKSDQTMKKVLELTGDPLPYGIEPNRHVLEAIIGYSVEQGIIPRRFSVDEIFAPGTHELAG
jgi:4,5-dihydroxyphthalate decarboxylase